MTGDLKTGIDPGLGKVNNWIVADKTGDMLLGYIPRITNDPQITIRKHRPRPIVTSKRPGVYKSMEG